MSEVWDQARLERYITEGIEESLTLDYKAAPALDKSDKKKIEITKDVSAMANSAGGILVYGIAEFQDKAREHLPERLDPVDRTAYSKEWLEHIIGNIQPQIDGVIIHPVPISSAANHVVYVVEIPQSHTAHQARDMRYYKRFNFESVMMSDYEIRDVMGRGQYPKIELEFEFQKTIIRQRRSDSTFTGSEFTRFALIPILRNSGRVFAQYVDVFLELPEIIRKEQESMDRELDPREVHDLGGIPHSAYFDDNTVRDYVGNNSYGPARYVPILPRRRLFLDEIELTQDFESIDIDTLSISWEVSADNAPTHTGQTPLADIQIVVKHIPPIEES